MNTKVCKKEIEHSILRKRSLDVVLENFSPEAKAKILQMRKNHSCLMELPRQTILSLQRKALYINYMSGESRRKLEEPTMIEMTDEKGFTYQKITQFRYRNK